ncbi:MAG TPA: NAD(P) transhydrogenase subunit alpha [Patescibacteria group bacterium]|nr:NAD(P) transhydrogenase subunit alpha [Patescibacteria group bacterium]
MVVGVPTEIYPGERRVALVPAVLPNLKKAGLEVVVQAGAGAQAGYLDSEYEAKGAKILPDRAQVFSTADVIVQVLCHGANDRTGTADMPLLRPGQALIGFLRPLGSLETVQQVAATGASAFSFELMPRITRAQNMDALSSMATVAGYKAVIIAADTLPRMFPMMTTAAGTVTPARALVIGAGVAGLNAIATAHRLGAISSGYDVRSAAREQILSLGGRVVQLELETEQAEDQRGYAKAQDEAFYERQREQLGRVVAESDVVVTTAVVPGRRPPLLITADAVARMAPGSVIVDMAAERGGNCELTRSGEISIQHGVHVIGQFNLASTVPYHASQMYARNVVTFLLHLAKDGQIPLDRDDEILRETLLTRGGEIVQSRVREFFKLPVLAKS